MSATPTTQQIDPVAAQAHLIELEHPGLNLTDEKLIGLAKLQDLYHIQTAGVGTSFPTPIAFDVNAEARKELIDLVQKVFGRTVAFGFNSCNYVLRLTE